MLAPQLDQLVRSYKNVLLRKVNLVDWTTPAAEQAMGEYGFDAIPTLAFYDTSGEFSGTITGSDIDEIRESVEAAGAVP